MGGVGVGGRNHTSGMGLTFVYTEPLPFEKFKVTPEMEKALKIGFRPMVVVKADPTNFLHGYELYSVEGLGLNAEETEMLMKFSVLVMDAQMQEWTEVAMAKAGFKACEDHGSDR
jgi:hypothetical protein